MPAHTSVATSPAPVSKRSLLEVTDLSIATAQTTLVHPTSFTIAPGERVGLIGESGSGKSLTSSAVMGLLPDELTATGSITLTGTEGNLLERSDRQIARLRGLNMSMVFQEPMSALNPLMRVGAQVAEVMRIHRTQSKTSAAKRAIDLLGLVQLPDPQATARAYPHQLSGGQRQRVMLAMALANDPQLLICDEPTTALDVTVQRQVLDLVLDAVTTSDTGLLFITHDLAVVASVCQKVMVMYHGEIVEVGATEQIFTDPQHDYTRGLLAASDLTATDDDGRLFTIATARAYDAARLSRPRSTPPEAQGTGEQQVATASGPADDTGAVDGTGPADKTGPADDTGSAEPRPQTAFRPDAAQEQAPLIEIEGLYKTYQRTKSGLFSRADTVNALTDVSLSIRTGQRFGIVGESGSGKSTLLKILSGLEPLTSGYVRVGDCEIASASQAQLRAMREELQIVFQDPFASLDPRMQVADIVAEPLVAMGVPAAGRREKVNEMLEAVGLDAGSRTRYPHQFSGGQRQRISIARALVCRPRILVADEPVSALDVSVRAQVLNLLTDLVEDYELTLVFVSHDLGVVRHLCSDVVVMKDGRIVESGDVASIYDHPQHEYTASLVAATPTLAAALHDRAG
ncbi:dipeptide ABC transporter ATP-binding protein [Brevibacterium sp. UBA7493]|uniref:dipeptide ABC transporter ATP-binding protein n=1 Tax=Brevibacterium sp. UBA7493 TaxID=1946121 RepID=UPI00257F617D|nr:ABC transporter ATP-binding protein [Brevibacterium sp. UBA7493]